MELTFRVVEALQVGDKLLQTWQEAVEREVTLGELELVSLLLEPRRRMFSFPASRKLEPVRGSKGEIAAIVAREQRHVAGVVEVRISLAAAGMFKVRVRIENQSALEDLGASRDEAMLRSLVSTHTILGVHEGEFVSLTDPPDECRDFAADCRNVGVWPILVGEAGEKDTMLSSPIILYDYPQIAPESPGDLFDATEIDEILTLRILTMTDAEKQAAAAVDERVATMVRRSEALAREQLQALHGTIRGLRPVREGVTP